MPPIPPQVAQIACPNCGNPFQTPLYTVVDVTQQPELKQALLTGRLNVAVCPKCGMATMLGVPLVYHDAAKQLCLVYIPSELKLTAEQQEQVIGDTTRAIMQSLPAEASRAHLLTPRRFMSLASLIDSILEADGVSREVLEQQRKRVEVISQLAQALPDEQQFARLVEQHREALTPEFFATLDAFIAASEQEGQDESGQMLRLLRQQVAEITGFSGDPLDEGIDLDMQQVIERLQMASDEELEEVLAEVRPAIDYSFFQTWTAGIEALEREGQHEAAQRLTQRRKLILDTVERMDKEAQAAFDAAMETLREVLTASDTRAALEERAASINEAFMLVVSANIAQAQRLGQHELEMRLEEISKLAFDVIQAQLPPEERFINELMLAETAEQSRNLLRTHAAQVTPAFVKRLNELADEQEKRGVKVNADHLRRLAREASAMLF